MSRRFRFYKSLSSLRGWRYHCESRQLIRETRWLLPEPTTNPSRTNRHPFRLHCPCLKKEHPDFHYSQLPWNQQHLHMTLYSNSNTSTPWLRLVSKWNNRDITRNWEPKLGYTSISTRKTLIDQVRWRSFANPNHTYLKHRTPWPTKPSDSSFSI